MPIVPVAEWAPDMPDTSEYTSVAQNVLPLTQESYSPFPSFVAGQSLGATCLGAITVTDDSANVYTFAGAGQALYVSINGGAWANVTGTDTPGGTGAGSGSPLNYSFTQFKDTVIVATGDFSGVQTITLTTSGIGTFADLSSTAPVGRFVTIIRDFCFIAFAHATGNPVSSYRLWWSGQGDPTSWPTPGSSAAQAVQSDYNDFPGNFGQISGIVSALNGADGAIFFDRGVQRIIYAGPPDVFDFQTAQSVRGTIFSNSIVQIGGVVYYQGGDGFYMFDGNVSVPIGLDKVDRYFLETYNPNNPWLVIGGFDGNTKTVFWCYPSPNSNVPTNVLAFNWGTGRWGVGNIANLQWLMPTLPVPSSFPRGGLKTLATLGGFVNQTYGLFNGTPLANAQIGSQVVQPFPGQKTLVQSVRPLVDGGSPTIAVSARDELETAETFGPDVAMNVIGECPQRVTGRYVRGRITVPSGTWNHIRGFDPTWQVAGIR